VSLEDDKFIFSGIRAGMYCDYLENEWLFKLNTALLNSRSAVAARADLEFKDVMEDVFRLRKALSGSMDYMKKLSGGKSAVEMEREQQAKEYLDYVKKVLGEEKVKELTKHGGL